MKKKKNSEKKKRKNLDPSKPIYLGEGIMYQINNIDQYTYKSPPLTKESVISFIMKCADEFEEAYPYSCIPNKLRECCDKLFN